jgi:hypothetical protein
VKLGEELLGALDPFGVERNTVNRTYNATLRLIMMANTFCASQRVNLVDLGPHADGRIWTLGLAHVAVNALIRDQ